MVTDWTDEDWRDERDPDPTPSFPDVLTGKPSLLDPAAQPPDLECSCGRLQPHTWWAGRPDRGFRGRWCPPSVSPCEGCRVQREAQQAAETLLDRQKRAGVPKIHQAFRWDRVIKQERGEPWGAFIRRVRELHVPHIGVSFHSGATARAICDWLPGHGSMYVEGPVGAGKSLMVGARVTAMLGWTGERREVLMPHEEVVRRYGRYAQAACDLRRDSRIAPGGQQRDVLLVDEEDMVERVAHSWSGDRDPLNKIARVHTLVLDDLGTVGASGGKGGELASKCLARLVRLRYDAGLPMLITSNVPLDSLGDHYETRTVDRLREMVGRRVHKLEGLPSSLSAQGYSWRNPPPLEPGEDRLTQAAGGN